LWGFIYILILAVPFFWQLLSKISSENEQENMKALVLKDYFQFGYEDFPNPPITENEVLIAVKACGICGSDVHGMDGSTGRRQPPIIMGHEAAGVIDRKSVV
jgi:D-arabinose 1-dehydrogenase-like Zn-dependent alcohol dehydrogenase